MGWRARRGGNPDANNQDLADLARRLGADVTITTGVPFFLDWVLGFRGVTVLVEVKNPKRRRSGKEAEREARQAQFRKTWRGGPCVQVETGDDVIRLLTGPDMVRWIREATHGERRSDQAAAGPAA